ncbi:MAG: PIG-L deacetylase family protein [Patescibacteria group bacterium]|nr:PIG-L deacetylase family protein [Patescibacteria group bacterium]
MKILFIFPHPDDETVFAGGTIARHVANGDSVIWICASFGERGGISEKRSPRLFYFAYFLLGHFPFLIRVQNLIICWLSIFRKPSKTLLEIRKSEAGEVARIYGISKLHFLGIEDMRFEKSIVKIEDKVREYIELYQPELIYTFHPNGITDHPDHRYLAKSVIKVVQSPPADKRPKILGATIPAKVVKKYKLPLFGTMEISQKIELNEQELGKKLQAINTYKSQKYLWEIFLQKYPELLEKEYFIELV